MACFNLAFVYNKNNHLIYEVAKYPDWDTIDKMEDIAKARGNEYEIIKIIDSTILEMFF